MVPNIISVAVVATSLLFGAPATQNGPDSDPAMNIVETAISAGSFNTLVAALKAAGLVETLSGPGPFTVFAPTDEAFAQIPADQLNALLADKEALTAVLTYHVVAGKVMAEDVVKLSSATTVNGQDVEIKVMDGKVMIDGAQVTTADIDTTNGVIHVIDKVILPKM
jgi:uncharacterized surface protein with fasciclin (FAS1) repeats